MSPQTITGARAMRDGGIDAMAALNTALRLALAGLSCEEAADLKLTFGKAMAEVALEMINPAIRAFPELKVDDAAWTDIARDMAGLRANSGNKRRPATQRDVSHAPTQVRRLTPADACQFQALRLAGLQNEPLSFASSYEEEKDLSASVIEDRLAFQPDRATFGAFDDESLVGLVSLGRENLQKLSHKAFIWGMYVRPASRGKGIARALIGAALSLARAVPDLTQVNLCVNARNLAAIQLYESIGFKVFGREPGSMLINGELQDEVHMCFRLADD